MAYRLEHDRAHNIFIDQAKDFLNGFRNEDGEEDSLWRLASFIVQKLLKGADKEVTDPTHPFQRYGVKNEASTYANFTRLAQDIMLEVQEQTLKPHVVSFFHSNGPYREDMEDLVIDHYYDFVLRANGIEPGQNDDNESDESDDSHSDDEVQEITSQIIEVN